MFKFFLQKTLRQAGLRREKAALGSIGRTVRANLNARTTPGPQICRFFSSVSGGNRFKVPESTEDEGRIESAASKIEEGKPQIVSADSNSEAATGPVNFEALMLMGVPFVDKSLFIKEVVESTATAILFTRPRRWGKTLSMTMLKSFLEIDTGKSGEFDLTQRPKKRVFFEGAEDYKVNKNNIVKLQKLKIAYEKAEIFIEKKKIHSEFY